jgi:hypothetical protein
MFKFFFRWVYWWKLSRKAKKHLKRQIEITKSLGPAEPPTFEEVKDFIVWAEKHGISFQTRVQPLPKTPRHSAEISLN